MSSSCLASYSDANEVPCAAHLPQHIFVTQLKHTWDSHGEYCKVQWRGETSVPGGACLSTIPKSDRRAKPHLQASWRRSLTHSTFSFAPSANQLAISYHHLRQGLCCLEYGDRLTTRGTRSNCCNHDGRRWDQQGNCPRKCNIA